MAILAVALLVAPSALAAPPAELITYQPGDGQTYFALSLTPPADVGQDQPCHVVILFDTSASQAGPYRDTALAALDACLGKLRPADRVELLAVDLDARPLVDHFVAVDSPEMRSALDSLRREPPLGSTDMQLVLQKAAARFDDAPKTSRAVLYIGDGMSTANLLGTDAFRALVDQLRAARIPVSSYAIGPQRDTNLLAALANQTGGNLYVDAPMVWADDQQGIGEDRAMQENLRRGTAIGRTLADWTRARMLWPAEVTWPAALGDVYPTAVPPLRTDRDTIVVGVTTGPLDAPLAVSIEAAGEGGPVDLQWTTGVQSTGDGNSYLAQVVDMARSDGGITLPTLGSAGLAEMGRLLNTGVDQLSALAERAAATGDMQSADLMSQAVLRRDPGNVQAKTVERVVHRPRAQTVAAAGDDLNLVRPAPVAAAPATGAGAPQAAAPSAGSLTDRFSKQGKLLGEFDEQRRVFAQMLRKEVENTVADVRQQMKTDPDAAAQQLKLTLQNVQGSPELSPEVRAQLVDKLQIALREVQRASSIKAEQDALRESEMAAARERQLLTQRLARQREKEKQLLDRFNNLIDEQRYTEAGDVAATVDKLDPQGVAPRSAVVWSRLKRNDYLEQVTRAARWSAVFDTLYPVELSSMPFPDEPPIVYPAAPVWEELSNNRKRFSSVDLKAAGGAEERINQALASPLHATGLDFTDVPLEDVVSVLQEDYDIPVQLDTPALADVGLAPDEPITVNLRNISLRSALRIMLKNLQLTYVIRDEVLFITTPDEAETELVVKVYPVADLVIPIEVPGMGGGGGMFSVPDQADQPASEQAGPADLTLTREKPAATATTDNAKPARTIAVDPAVSPDVFWDGYFSHQRPDPALVRRTVRKLMNQKQTDQVIALIEAALRHGQPQPWMYESLGIAMELGGRSKADIERVVMSAVDFSTSPDELMYIAKYLSRIGLDRRALQLYQQVAKVEPLRADAYALGLRAAQRVDNLPGIQWATVGILSQAWPKDQAEIELTASRVAKATLQRLDQEGRTSERDAYLKKLQQAVVRDCVVNVSWTGDADVDIQVQEPSGTVCSVADPRTSSGGVSLGDAYAGQENSSTATLSEGYVCPQAFDGTYRVRIHRVWGEVAAGKVTVDVYLHKGTDRVKHERQQIELGNEDAMVVFDLDEGRRAEPLEAGQLAGAVQRQQEISRAVLAQQLSSLSDERAAPNRTDILRRRRAWGLGAGAVGYQPIISSLPTGTSFSVTGVVSADRRYVRITAVPSFTGVGNVQTFTFAGAASQTGGGGTGTTGF